MKLFAIIARLFYFGIILLLLFQHQYMYAAENLAFFIVLLPLLWFARKDEQFYLADAGFMLLFSLPIVLSYFGVVLASSIIGLDKLFHLSAGALLGYTSLLLWPKHRGAAVAFAFTVGIGWELYEWTFGVVNLADKLIIIDTFGDLVADMLGAIIVLLIYKRKLLYRNN